MVEDVVEHERYKIGLNIIGWKLGGTYKKEKVTFQIVSAQMIKQVGFCVVRRYLLIVVFRNEVFKWLYEDEHSGRSERFLRLVLSVPLASLPTLLEPNFTTRLFVRLVFSVLQKFFPWKSLRKTWLVIWKSEAKIWFKFIMRSLTQSN